MAQPGVALLDDAPGEISAYYWNWLIRPCDHLGGGPEDRQQKEMRGSLLFHCLVAKMSELTVGQLGATESSQV